MTSRRGKAVHRLLPFALGLGAGIGAAAGAFALLSATADVAPVDGSPASTDVAASLPTAAASPELEGDRGAERAAQPSPSAQAAPDRADGDVVTPELLAYARAEARRGWAEVRKDAMPEDVIAQVLRDYENQVRTLPSHWARRYGEVRNKKDADDGLLGSSDGLEIVAKVDSGHPGLASLPRDGERFAGFFVARSAGATVSGMGLHAAARPKWSDGTVVTFPAGAFAVGDFTRHQDPFPADVTVRGAGMDATLLVLGSSLDSPSGLRRFAVEDCTLWVPSSLTSVRDKPSVLALRRVRFTGFDRGSGSSEALSLGKAMLQATDCRFEGGYGSYPTGGNLLQASDPFLARFDRCTFERMTLNWTSRGTVFANCTMSDLLYEPSPAPRYENCRITVVHETRKQDWEALRRDFTRDLNTLFPNWQERARHR